MEWSVQPRAAQDIRPVAFRKLRMLNAAWANAPSPPIPNFACRGLSDGFWLGLQSDHDLPERRQKIGADLARIEPAGVAA